MVAEDGDHSVGFIVRVEFLLDGSIMRGLLVKLNLESLRSVEGTENLGSEPLHVSIKVGIQLGGLSDVGYESQLLTIHEEAK
jgi:hypothetical protein